MIGEKIKFLVAGGSTTLASYALYVALLQVGVLPTPAYAAAYVAGIVWSYLVNSLWVFKTPLSLASFFKFPIVYLVQALASLLLFRILEGALGINAYVVPVLIAVVTIPLTYVISRFILVTHSRKSTQADQ